MNNKLAASICLILTSLLSTSATAAESATMCIFDPSGAGGNAYQTAKKYQTAALQWGVNLTLKPYTSETVAVADFRSGQCDAALLTGVRAQLFNRKAYSVEALGLITDYKTLKKTVEVLAKPAAASLMKSGDYETVGIYPAGAVYLFLNDKQLSSISSLAGKKICALDFDEAAKFMVPYIGGQLEPADVGTFASKFNNGSCDVSYAPATAYKPLELYKGLGDNGGVVNYPVAQLTLQMLIRTDEFPAEFGASSRSWSVDYFDEVLGFATSAEAQISAHYWIQVSESERVHYDSMLSDVRAELSANNGYDPTIVKLIERIKASQ